MENYDWKYVGKIAASIALSVIIGLFWISNYQKSPRITKNPGEFTLGSVFEQHLTKRTLVVFWASWCVTCKEDLLAIKKLRTTKLPEGFSILAVNIDEKKNWPQAKFLWSQLDVSGVELIFDETGDYQNVLSVDLLPTYFLFEQNGRTLLRLEGQVNWEDQKLRSLLFE